MELSQIEVVERRPEDQVFFAVLRMVPGFAYHRLAHLADVEVAFVAGAVVFFLVGGGGLGDGRPEGAGWCELQNRVADGEGDAYTDGVGVVSGAVVDSISFWSSFGPATVGEGCSFVAVEEG